LTYIVSTIRYDPYGMVVRCALDKISIIQSCAPKNALCAKKSVEDFCEGSGNLRNISSYWFSKLHHHFVISFGCWASCAPRGWLCAISCWFCNKTCSKNRS